MMTLEVLRDPEAVARRAAERIAAEARAAVAARGRFLLALSGGATPRRMYGLLAEQEVAWDRVHVFQVDERVVPLGHPERNFSAIREGLLDRVSVPPAQVHAMPVDERDLAVAAERYAESLRTVAGNPPRLDLVHLGLGADGHTASLVPGDQVCEVDDAEVAVSGPYAGTRRMTLTFPVLNAARGILWIVTGVEKAAALKALQAGDRGVPAGRVAPNHAVILADEAAAGPNL